MLRDQDETRGVWRVLPIGYHLYERGGVGGIVLGRIWGWRFGPPWNAEARGLPLGNFQTISLARAAVERAVSEGR